MKFTKEDKDTYNLKFNLKDDPRMIWKLASSPSSYLLDFPELLEIRSSHMNSTVLHQMAYNCIGWPEEERKKVLDFIFNIKNLDNWVDLHSNTPLHFLAKRGVIEVMEHPLHNTVLNFSKETPYCLLLEHVKTKDLESCINLDEIYKVLHKPQYGSPRMPLDYLEKRSYKPTLGQLKKWGIPILKDSRLKSKKLGYKDLSEFKENNSLRFIIS